MITVNTLCARREKATFARRKHAAATACAP